MTNFNPKISSKAVNFSDGIPDFGKFGNIQNTEKIGNSFENVLTGMVQEINKTTNAPDELMQEAVVGKADVHDVMAAISKAEIQVNLASSITKKVLQTYEKVMNIQI